MDANELLTLLPEIDLICDKEIRKKCIDTWLDAIRIGNWDAASLAACPIVVSGLSKRCKYNNIMHTRGVVQVSLAINDTLKKLYPDAGSCDRDTLIAGALLHDVGKLLEFTMKDGVPCASEQAAFFSHPVSGAYLAQKNALSQDIVHAILAHSALFSPGGDKAVKTREAQIIKMADTIAFYYLLMEYGAD